MKKLCAFLFLAAMTGPFSQAHAENYNAGSKWHGDRTKAAEKEWDISVGGGVLATPEYEGSDEYDVLALPYLDIKYRDRVTLNPLDGLRFNALTNDMLTLGVGVGVDFGRDDDDGDRLRGLGDIDATAEGQAFVRYTPGHFSAELTFAHDLISNGHEGWTAEAEAGYAIPMPEHSTFVRPSVGVTYASDNYNGSYFGVTNAQAANSNLPVYDADAGFKDVNAALFVQRRITQNWSLNGIVQYKHLIGDAADSPVTETESQFTGGVFAAYKF